MSWTEKPLRKIFKFRNGKAPDKSEDGEYPVFGSHGQIGFSDDYTHENAIIIGRVGAYCGAVEVCKGKFWPSDNTIVATPKDGYDVQFLYYLLDEYPLRRLAGGSAQPLLTQKVLKTVEVEVPDVSTQERIADTLSTYDDLIAVNQKRIEKLERATRLLYREWFVHQRFPGHERTKIVDGVPEGWKETTFGDVVTLHYGEGLREDDRIDGPYPVYGSSGVIDYHNRSLVDGPGIIVGRKGNVGTVFWCMDGFNPIDTVYYIDKEESSYFIYYSLKFTKFKNSDSSVPGLNRDFAYSRGVVIPTDEIRELFEKIASTNHKQIYVLKRQNNKLKKARDILVSRLISGEITV